MKHEPVKDHAERKRILTLIERCEKEQTMGRHICAECKHQYFMLYKRHLKCMNEQSEKYGEDIEPTDYCEEWEDRRAGDE